MNPDASPGNAKSTSASPAIRRLSWITCTLAILTMLGVFVGYVFARAAFIDLFESFDTDVPRLTILVLSLSPALSIILGIFLALLLFAKEIGVKNRIVTATINLIILCLAVVTGTVMAFALILPSIKLMQSIA